mmetsp:Transcript_17462/g.41263  ORF Transcript_17462/g.41263 Transcript_17462/m.41263 type:complete len:207 (-) Transcript_17462:255-875(-)
MQAGAREGGGEEWSHFVDAGREEGERHVHLNVLPGLIALVRGPVDKGVVHEGLEQRQKRLLVPPQHPQHLFARDAERPLDPRVAHRRLEGLRHAVRHDLRDLEFRALLETHVPVDVHNLSGGKVDEHVVEVPVAQPDHVPHHTHNREAAGVGAGLGPEVRGRHARTVHLLGDEVTRGLCGELRPHAPQNLVRPRTARGHGRNTRGL